MTLNKDWLAYFLVSSPEQSCDIKNGRFPHRAFPRDRQRRQQHQTCHDRDRMSHSLPRLQQRKQFAGEEQPGTPCLCCATSMHAVLRGRCPHHVSRQRSRPCCTCRVQSLKSSIRNYQWKSGFGVWTLFREYTVTHWWDVEGRVIKINNGSARVHILV